MKKIGYILVLALLLIIPAGLAGKTYWLADLSEYPIQMIILAENDRVAFSTLNANHTIIIDKVNNNSIDLDIFPYLKNVFYVTLKPDTYIKLDLNRDFIVDMIVRLERINGKNTTITLEKVYIDERPLSLRENTTDITGETVLDVPKEPDNKFSIIVFSSIVVLVIAGYILLRKRTK